MLSHVCSIAAGTLLPPFLASAKAGAWPVRIPTPSRTFPGLVPCIPGSRLLPKILLGTCTMLTLSTVFSAMLFAIVGCYLFLQQ